MSKILSIIPSQAYELIRDRIGAIVYTELQGQFALTSEALMDAAVYVVRSNPFADVDLPAVSIGFAGGNYDSANMGCTRANYTYHIDVFTKSKSGVDTQGDVEATKYLHRLLGVCRAILMNPIYKTLDYTPPFIQRVAVSDIAIAQMDPNDVSSSAMGRLTLNVVVNEDTSLLDADPVGSIYTQVKLALTDKGYRYKLNT